MAAHPSHATSDCSSAFLPPPPQRAKQPGHLYPMAMYSYPLMPPPTSVDKAIGERRMTNYTGGWRHGLGGAFLLRPAAIPCTCLHNNLVGVP
jgi:hypothetical protein